MSVAHSNQTAKLPLHEKHLARGAKLGQFGDWEVPLYYTSILEEHHNVRKNAGLFDVSHMGQIYISGAAAESFLQEILPRNIVKMAIGKAIYMPLLTEHGGIVDDVILYRFEPNLFLLIVNATNIKKDLDWLLYWKDRFSDIPGDSIAIQNESENKGMLALQGPRSAQIISQVFGAEYLNLGYFQIKVLPTGMVARTGYTGEDGFEIVVDLKELPDLWDRLFDAGKNHGLVPIGFGARDTLRLEAGLLLYGQDMNEHVTPIEAGISWAVDFRKSSFVGLEALLKQRQKEERKVFVGFEMIERGVPRHGCILVRGDKQVGEVTSGGFSPTLQKSIGMGYVPWMLANPGSEISVMIRDKALKAIIVELPFYTRQKTIGS